MVAKFSRFRPLVLMALVVAALGGLVGCAQAYSSCASGSSADCTSVLFIGNSYTSMNDLPGTFVRLATAGDRRVRVAMVAPGGQTLAGHVSSGDATAALSTGDWDYVVLQEQSEVPAMSDARRTGMLPAAFTLATQIRNEGATPLLFETWGHRAGLLGSGLADYAAMQQALDAGYLEASRNSGAELIPVGDIWAAAVAADPTLDLWQDDGSHPTALGTYLVAATFYARLFDEDPSDALAATCGCSAAVVYTIGSAVTRRAPDPSPGAPR